MSLDLRCLLLAGAGCLVGRLENCVAHEGAARGGCSNFAALVVDEGLVAVADEIGALKEGLDRRKELLEELAERWRLRLWPEGFPEMPEGVGKRWARRELRDILGRGTDRLLILAAPEEVGGVPTISFLTRRYHSVNTGKAPETTTERFDVRIGGAFLEYDGLLHTAFVSKQRLVLDGLIRTGDRMWYSAASRRGDREAGELGSVLLGRTKGTGTGDGASPHSVLTEFLFEFEQDPFATSTGTVVLRRHQSVVGLPDVEPTALTTKFFVTRPSKGLGLPTELQVGIPEKTSLTLSLFAGEDFGWLRGVGLPTSSEYRLEKTLDAGEVGED